MSIVSLGAIRLLDETLRDDFQASRDTYFFWLLVCAVIVAVGVVLEGPEIFTDIREKFSEWKPSRKIERWIVTISVIGWIFVSSGVVGEFIFDAVTSRADGQLQTFDSILLTDAQQKTAVANESARDAELSVHVLQAQTEGFKAQIAGDDARVRVAEATAADAAARVRTADARIAEANARAAEAQSMAKSADLARAELEARIAPRTLDVTQRTSIGNVLRVFAATFSARQVRLEWQSLDIEATIFGVEIKDALLRAGIQSDGPMAGLTLGGPPVIGLTVTGPTKDAPFIGALYSLLHTDLPKESMSAEASPKFETEPVTVTVGFKTPQGLGTLAQSNPAPK